MDGEWHTSEQSVGIAFLLLSLICLGTWPALLRLCSVTPSAAAASTTTNTPETHHYHHHYYHHQQQQQQHATSSLLESSNNNINNNSSANTNQEDDSRNLCHIYIDYATAYFVASIVPLFWMLYSQSGGDNNNNAAAAQWTWLGGKRIATACLGGILLSAGNLSMQWAVTLFAAPLTTVLALQSSMTVVLGTSMNYLLEPDKTHHPMILVAGVIVFLTAIGLASSAQYTYQKQQQQQQEQEYNNDQVAKPNNNGIIENYLKPRILRHGSSIMGIELEENHQKQNQNQQQETIETATSSSIPYGSNLHHRHGEDMNRIGDNNNNHNNSNTILNVEENQGESSSDSSHSFQKDSPTTAAAAAAVPITNNNNPSAMTAVQPWHGLAVAAAGGLCFGFFSPAVNIAVNDPFEWRNSNNSNSNNNMQDDIGSTTTAILARANLWFALAFWIASCIGNLILLQRQQQQQQQHQQSLSLLQILYHHVLQDTSTPMWNRKLALSAGAVCAAGNLLQFQGGQALGYATADLVQAYPLVSTVWDILVFGEFQSVRIPSRLFGLLVGMYVAYLSGIVLLATS